MATTLVLIRHGVTEATGKRLGGRTEASLSEDGREQARQAGKRIATLPVKAVYASPLARTWQTAELVAESFGRDPVACDGLLEVEYGRWTDRPLKPLLRTKLWPVIQSRPSLVEFPDGETIRRAQLRAVDAIEELVARHRRDVIVAVSHADVIKAVVSFYLGQPLDLFQRLHVGPASVTILGLGPGARPVLLRFNDDGPLRAEAYQTSGTRKPRTSTRATTPGRQKGTARG